MTTGSWVLCSDVEYSGTCRTYAPGRYPDLGYGMAHQVSSARLVRSARDAPVVFSPGLPPATGQPGRAILYSERGLRGVSLAVSGPVTDLVPSNIHDAAPSSVISSMYVEAGTWVACSVSFFRGNCRAFGPGRYDDLAAAGFDRGISSIRPGTDVAPPPGPPLAGTGIEFFSEPNFAGERLRVDRDMGDLVAANFNDRASSVVIVAGTWELGADAHFGGSCAVYRPGRYPQMGGLTRQVSSARHIE